LGLAEVRCAEVWIAALRGQGAKAVATLEWLEPVARATENPEILAKSLGCSVIARTGLGQTAAAAALFAELCSHPAIREGRHHMALLPAMVRAALQIGEREPAERLVESVEPRYPYAEHALIAATASLSEARGDLAGAADTYADAADRWERFGVVPEQAFALLGRGRCLLALDDPAADEPLRRAHDIFSHLHAAPYIAECDTLLAQVAERAS
jgi:ATP/maltotriose-dependent transcriptional regulator MalT